MWDDRMSWSLLVCPADVLCPLFDIYLYIFLALILSADTSDPSLITTTIIHLTLALQVIRGNSVSSMELIDSMRV
jgi:hypothetical protein